MNKKTFKFSIAQLKIRHIWAIAYLGTLFVALSFYMPHGYFYLGEDKFDAFRNISLIGIPGWLALRITDFCIDREWKKENHKSYIGMNFVYLFMIAAIVSTLCSEYRHLSFWGYKGWAMGAFSMLAFGFIYLISKDLFSVVQIRLFWGIICFLGLISAIVLCLGIMNRFSIFPVRPWGEADHLISTLGNIFWYCGYLCIWAGIGIGLFLKIRGKYKSLILGLYVWICIMAGITCGLSSVYLIWGAVSIVSFIFMTENAESLRQWAMVECIAAFILPCIRMIGFLRPYRMWYSSSILQGFTYGDGWILPFIGLTVFAIVVALGAEKIVSNRILIRNIIIGISAGSILSVGLLLILNNLIPGGIWPVRGMDIFTFTNTWGNSRGAIIKATFAMIKNLSFYEWLFGKGCDCFSSYAYSVDESVIILRSTLHDTVLTNAHNEWLTMLINEGILGVVSYAGIFICHLRSLYHYYQKENSGIALGVILSITGYLTIGLTGFMHILATPFLFLILGMAAGLTNRDGINTIKNI